MFTWASYDRMMEMDLALKAWPYMSPPRHRGDGTLDDRFLGGLEQSMSQELPKPPEDQRFYRIERDPHTRKIVSSIVDGNGNPVNLAPANVSQ